MIVKLRYFKKNEFINIKIFILILMNVSNNDLSDRAKIKNLLDIIKKRQKYINNLEKILYDEKKQLKEIKQKLFVTCKHNWVPDRSYNNYDHTPYYCTICGSDN